MAYINYLDRTTRISPVLKDRERSLIDTLKVLIAVKGDFYKPWLKTVFEFTGSDYAALFAVPPGQPDTLSLLSKQGCGVESMKKLSSKVAEILEFAAGGDQPVTYNTPGDRFFESILLSAEMKSGIIIPLNRNKKGDRVVALLNSKYEKWYEKEVFTYLQQVREVSLTILNNR